MSAFLCTETHVGILARAIGIFAPHATIEGERIANHQPRLVFDVLAIANAKSIDARYPSSTPTLPVEPSRPIHRYPSKTAVEIIKLAHCFEYQSCEARGWYDSPAHGLIQELIYGAIRALPGYSEAAWTAEDPTHTVETLRVAL